MTAGPRATLGALTLLISCLTLAAPALDVLGKDYVFPNKLDGLPTRLSDFKGLQINSFKTSDGVKLSYWEAGSGKLLVFVPGWSANGAEYLNVMSILARHYHVIVLDQRNQGLSDKVDYGNRIARYAMDLKELTNHLKIASADYCGWSMGASVLWSYIDLFGGSEIRKAVFVDEPVSIVAHAHWSALERRDTGAFMPSPDALIEALQAPVQNDPDPQTSNFVARSKLRDSPYFANSESFAESVIQNDPAAMGFKKDYHQTALHIGAGLIAKIKTAQPQRIATDCLSCRLQFQQLLPFNVAHPVEILWEGYQRAGNAP